MNRALRLLTGVVALTVPLAGTGASTAAIADPTDDVFLSEYVEGSGDNKALELTNGTDAPIGLGAYVLQLSFNGGSFEPTIPLDDVILPAGETWVVGDDGADADLLARIDQTSSSSFWNGNDAIILLRDGTVVDSFGRLGEDPGSEWFANGVGTQDETLRRKASVTTRDTVPDDPFDPSVEWDTFPRDTFDGLALNGEPPPDPCDIAPTAISAIQGSGAATPLGGEVVVTSGVVNASSGGAGFFLQDPVGDGDPSTSDGIFVFRNGVDTRSVAEGDAVTVCGTAGEFRGLTQIALDEVTETGTGSIVPVDFSLPASRDLETYEGMLLDVDQRLYFTDVFNLGSFNEGVMSGEAPLTIPTDLFLPGSPEQQALATENTRNAVKIDYGSGFLGDVVDERGRPVRRGDAVDVDQLLVMTETFGGKEFFFLDYPGGVPAPSELVMLDDRPDRPALGDGETTVASFNTHNYWTSIDLDAWADCAQPLGAEPGDFLDPGHPAIQACGWEPRGARSPAQLAEQEAQLVDAILAMDADVVALQELETPGIGEVNAGDDPDETLDALVDALNEVAGAGTWAHVPMPDGFFDLNTNAIHNGIIYRPAEVTWTGVAATDPSAAGIYDRIPLAAMFTDGGERFTVVSNHFKSKGCGGATGDDEDQGDGQACFNSTRLAQAEALQDWIHGDLRDLVKAPTILAMGDLNAYAQEDPIRALQAGARQVALTDLVASYGSDEDHSYSFFGEEGRLDHAFGTHQMADKVTGVEVWHINADEAAALYYYEDLASGNRYRSSDHDPVLVSFSLD